MNRFDVTEAIVAAKIAKVSVARHCQEGGPEQGMDDGCPTRADGKTRNKPRQWANCLDSEKSSDSVARGALQGSLPPRVPTDPLIYRFYELVNVYGTTLKVLIHEEFGDGIMSAIDFDMDIHRHLTPRVIAFGL